MTNEMKSDAIQAYNERHPGQPIPTYIAAWGRGRPLHMVVVAEHFIHNETRSKAARLSGLCTQAAFRICGMFQHHAILTCQTLGLDPQRDLVPMILGTTVETNVVIEQRPTSPTTPWPKAKRR